MPSPRHSVATALLLTTIAAVGCGGASPSSPPSGATEPDPTMPSAPASTAPATPGVAETEPPSETAALDLEPIAEGLRAPVAVALPDDGSGDMYVLEQAGRVVRLPGGSGPPQLALDITKRVGSGGERGLLGLAFSPTVADDRRLFFDYTDNNGDTIIAEYQLRDDGTIDAVSERVVLKVSQPAANHNGGDLHFGPDGMLYIAFGDGGGSNSQNGRRMDTLLGKILRIDALGSADDGKRYAVPPDNPFVGERDVEPEIWATGLRNPWRFSIDPGGALWIGDVGAGAVEEIDYAPTPGLDFGWDAAEGTVCRREPACDDPDLIQPVAEYRHPDGCVVTGGLVYQGSAIESLAGRYVLADYCTGVISTIDALLGYGAVQSPEPLLETGRSVVSFGQDADGELLVVDHQGGLFRLVARP